MWDWTYFETNHKLKHSWKELLYLHVQNLISIIDPVTYLKNQSIRKKRNPKNIKKIKITNAQKKVVKKKHTKWDKQQKL